MNERYTQISRTGKTQMEARMLVENAASQNLLRGKNYRVNLIKFSGSEPNVSCTIQFVISE